MSRSLAERIGSHTRQVVKEKDQAQREENKALALEILTAKVKTLAKCGEKLFLTHPEKRELVVDITTTFNPLKWDEVKNAFIDIGFEIHTYPMGYFLAIPEVNVSKEIHELLEIYNKTYEEFCNIQKQQAESDCKEVLKKLQENEYKVEGIDKVSVNFKSESNSEEYQIHVNDIMEAEGFVVSINEYTWHIHIQNESD